MREAITVPAGDGGSRNLDLTKHVTIIADEIKRLDQVVVGFLKFARPDELKLQPVRLTAVISEVTSMTTPEAERRGVTIRPSARRRCPTSTRIRHAAAGAAEPGAQRLSGDAQRRHAQDHLPRRRRRRVEIDVEDTGVGIAPENLSRIFDLYFTTKERGSGIGLSMVYRIVQLHDGEVEVQSTPGRGTRFRLIFPQA